MNIGEEILKLLKSEITEIEYIRYIKHLKYDKKSSSHEEAIFIAPNALVFKWINNRYKLKIKHLFEVKNSSKVHVEIVLQSYLDKKNSHSVNIESKKPLIHSTLNPSYTFNNFIFGGSNQFAYSAVKSVSEKPGTLYNPLFLHGGVGLGKTHLMQSAGNVFEKQGKNVIYTTAEQLLNDFKRHIRNNSMEKFASKYRTCDVLLVDDIQFLSNKTGTQEEFFHTFEALKGANKQIILTADRHPKKITGFTDRLISRFEWGLVADIQYPELETKIAIIEKKCEINKIVLTRDITNYIATVIESNVREIEGILSKLHAYSQLIGTDIDLEFTKSVLKDQVQEKSKALTIDSVTQFVSKELNIKLSEVKSKGRTRVIVYARRVAIYICRELTKSTMPELAKYFGMKDHTAISHTVKKINSMLKDDSGFKLKVDEIINKLTSNSA